MLTMEVILSTAFGRAIDVQGGKGGKLYEAAVKAFSDFSPDSQKKKMPVARMIQFLLRKPICVFPNYVSTSIEAFGGLLCYGAPATAFRRKRSDASVLSKDLLIPTILMTESWVTEVRSCPWPTM